MANRGNRVTTRCPSCSKTFQIPSGVLGKRTRCTQCGDRFELKAVGDDSSHLAAPSPALPPVEDSDFLHGESDVSETFAPPVQTLAPNPRRRSPEISLWASRAADYGGFRFLPLRFICLMVEVIVAFTAVVGIIVLMWQVIEFAMQEDTTLTDMRNALALTFVQFVGGTVILAVALLLPQLIRLLLKIEENTSASVAAQSSTNSELVGLMDQLSQVESRGETADSSY